MLGALTGVLWDWPLYFTLALGMYLSLRVCGFPDFTVDGSFALGMAGLFIGVEHAGDSALVGAVAAVLLGAAAGGITGAIYTYTFKPEGLYKLLAGLMVMFSVVAVTFRVLRKAETQSLGQSRHFLNLLRDRELGWGMGPWRWLSLMAILILLSVLGFALAKYLTGRQGVLIRAAGMRPLAVGVLGKSNQRYLILGLMIANGVVGLGGWTFGVMNSSVEYRSPGMIVDALGALLLGEAVFDRLSGKRRIAPSHAILACVIGSLAYSSAKGMAAFFLGEIIGESFLPQDHKLVVSAIILLTILISSRGMERAHDARGSEVF